MLVILFSQWSINVVDQFNVARVYLYSKRSFLYSRVFVLNYVLKPVLRNNNICTHLLTFCTQFKWYCTQKKIFLVLRSKNTVLTDWVSVHKNLEILHILKDFVLRKNNFCTQIKRYDTHDLSFCTEKLRSCTHFKIFCTQI